MIPGSETSKVVRGASAPESSSSRSSSSRGVGQYCGAGTGQSCQTGRRIASRAWLLPSSSQRSSVPGSSRGTTTARGSRWTPTGRCVASAGDVDGPMLPRSCNKPIQALGMLEAGLTLEGELLALACASHSGEPFHIEGVRRILAVGRALRGRAADAAGLPARRRGPRAADPGRRVEGAGADELLGQARGDARDLRRQRVADRELPRRRPPAPAGDRRDASRGRPGSRSPTWRSTAAARRCSPPR